MYTKAALKLEQKQLHERGNLACQLANEVGNPMTAMYGAIDLLHQHWREKFKNPANDITAEQDINNCFHILYQQTQRVDNLLQQLRRFNTLTSSQESFTNINEVIQAVVALARVESSDQNNKIVLELDTHIPAIILDRSALVFCVYHSLNGLLEVCIAGNEILVSSKYDENGTININIQCHYNETGITPRRVVAGNKTLDILEQYAESIREIISHNAGYLLAYCVPEKYFGITLVFPAEQS